MTLSKDRRFKEGKGLHAASIKMTYTRDFYKNEPKDILNRVEREGT